MVTAAAKRKTAPVLICQRLGTPPAAWPAVIAPDSGLAVTTWYYRGTAGGDRPSDPKRITVQDHVDDAVALMDHEGSEWRCSTRTELPDCSRSPDFQAERSIPWAVRFGSRAGCGMDSERPAYVLRGLLAPADLPDVAARAAESRHGNCPLPGLSA